MGKVPIMPDPPTHLDNSDFWGFKMFLKNATPPDQI